MEFVKNFTPSDFQAKNFTPSISPNFNSFSKKKTQKMSENGEIYTAGKNFTLMALTNSNSARNLAKSPQAFVQTPRTLCVLCTCLVSIMSSFVHEALFRKCLFMVFCETSGNLKVLPLPYPAWSQKLLSTFTQKRKWELPCFTQSNDIIEICIEILGLKWEQIIKKIL